MISAEGFRESFPAFASEDDYPDARIAFWLKLAQKRLNKARWGDFYEEGIYLFIAHNLTLERNVDGGGSVGTVSSESQSIGDMSFSVSYDTSINSNAGQMAATIYGQQYLDLVRIVGAGGIQL